MFLFFMSNPSPFSIVSKSVAFMRLFGLSSTLVTRSPVYICFSLAFNQSDIIHLFSDISSSAELCTLVGHLP
ncbi:hypothetical protein CW304_16760 [Bacillus sp. UFRGS-B20]|nr:hypothetical protein CW304_16760 [Bacillus sp. UFRGS-B20]